MNKMAWLICFFFIYFSYLVGDLKTLAIIGSNSESSFGRLTAFSLMIFSLAY